MRLARIGRSLARSLAFVALATAGAPVPRAAEPGPGPGAERPHGLARRVPWTSSRIQGTPDPPPPYRTEPAFPRLKFAEPLAMAMAPGGHRWFLAQRYGQVLSFPDDPAAAKADLVLDLKRQILGLALHPDFARNGDLFVAGPIEPGEGRPRRVRVSRLKISGEPPRGDPRSEQVILEWPSQYHDGGCLAFGPDGCLYIAAGDGGGDENGQGLGDLSSSILRIDVDRAGSGRPYAIPHDNPFVGVAGARPEVWAYGLRQPWRFSIDRATGDLWAGDVGQDLWEMVYLVRRGGNYGWNVREGSHPYQPWRRPGPTPILPPVAEHSHAEARSLTGGYVYRGARLKDLGAAYIYGDYDTGKIWALRYDGASRRVVWHKEIADSTLRIAAFGEDRAGELYLVDHMGGGIHRLVPSPPAAGRTEFPCKLSRTGLFASVRDLRPAPGLIPYAVNAPLWSDGAVKERFLAIPGDARIEFDAVFFPEAATGRGPHGWKFPDGTVLVKTFLLDLEKGNPGRRVRLETRILHHERLVGTEEVGDQFWRGYTYVWDDDQGDATLLEDPRGLDRTYTVLDRDAPGGARRQTWHFPGRAECMLCHTMPAKFVLGVNTLQMNRDFDYGGAVDNQLRAWEHAGLFTKPLPAPPERLPRLVDPSDTAQDLERRARSYLHANCSHCHRAFGGGNAGFQLLATLDRDEMGILGARPALGTFGIPDVRVALPGDPDRSVLVHRMSTPGVGRMPPLASSVVDAEALRLLRAWIRGLSPPGTAPKPVGR
jgi:uncharacterized repeat protein (TIGR03806 family)